MLLLSSRRPSDVLSSCWELHRIFGVGSMASRNEVSELSTVLLLPFQQSNLQTNKSLSDLSQRLGEVIGSPYRETCSNKDTSN